jgi:hypothetical protein
MFALCLLGLANKNGINHPLVFSGFQVKWSVQVEGLTQVLIKLAETLIQSLEDLSCSWPFSLLSSCPLIVLPDLVQVAGSLSHH